MNVMQRARERERERKVRPWWEREQRKTALNLLGGLEIKALSGKVIIESGRLMITSEIHGYTRESQRE